MVATDRAARAGNGTQSRRRLAALLLAVLAIGLGAAVLLGGLAATRTPPGPLVVLYVIDTLRRDRLGLYGHTAPTTPAINALAAECAVFDRAFANAPWTLPSVVSLLTSRDPLEHRVLTRGERLDAATVPLAVRLQAAGWRTAAIVSNPYAGQASGLDRGYDQFDAVRSEAVDRELLARWLEAERTRPAFVYLHSTEPHRPFRAPERHLERVGAVPKRRREQLERQLAVYRRLTTRELLRRRGLAPDETVRLQNALRAELTESAPDLARLYDAEVAWADDNVGRVVDLLRASGRWAHTLFILTSDHGEEFFDHGDLLHGQSLHAELVRVPLLVCQPGASFAGRRIADTVTLLDVMPTILVHAGLPLDVVSGQPLGPLLASAAPSPGPRVTSVRVNRHLFSNVTEAARGNLNVATDDGRWRAIWNVEDDRVSLYDTEADPAEQRDRAADDPERAAALGAVARGWARGRWPADVAPTDGSLGGMEAQTVERLRELGYVE